MTLAFTFSTYLLRVYVVLSFKSYTSEKFFRPLEIRSSDLFGCPVTKVGLKRIADIQRILLNAVSLRSLTIYEVYVSSKPVPSHTVFL